MSNFKIGNLLPESLIIFNESGFLVWYQSTLAIDSTTRSILREFSAATQMRPVSTA